MNAIYARVSDQKLKDDGQRRQDVNRQIELLKTRAGQDALIFSDDGISAFKEDYNARPAFLKLMREIRAHRVQQVWIESLDRWSRRIENGLSTLREASEAGCTVSSIADGEVDITTSSGWFKSGVSLLLAEWASRDKSERVRSGMDRAKGKAENICEACGIVHMGRHPSTCQCPKCLKKRVGKTNRGEKSGIEGAAIG
jgi:DNA invertase Pin-like site-specific DNA recombinase